MQYDPIKNSMAWGIELFPPLRKLFFCILDLVLLRQWYVKRSIKKLFPSDYPIRFYDAGAGFCQYSDFILSNWQSSIAFALDLKTDYVEAYAHFASNEYGKRFSWVGGDLVTYQPRHSYNLIAAIDILEHIENDQQVLHNFYQCLSPGGKLIISTPSDLDEAARFTAEHVRPGYNPQELKDKLLAAGFFIIIFGYSYGKWGKLSWLLTMKKPLQLIAISKLMILLLPVYYIFTYPLAWLLMQVDIRMDNKSGNGLIVVAEKRV
jgi:SAM-dependent methyltransferase